MNKETKAYKNKKVYNREYNKLNCKQFKVTLNKKTDDDVIRFLEKQPNKSMYIKNLIRNDMK